MVGRATFGRPWIFKEIRDSIDNAPFEVSDVVPSTHKAMTADWMLDVLKEQVRQSVERIDEYRGILQRSSPFGSHPALQRTANFRQTRIEMLRAETVESLFDIMERIRPLLHGESAPTLF